METAADGVEVVAEASVDEPVVLGEAPIVLDAVVGQTLDSRLLWETGHAYRWRARGGPPGLHVRPDGTFAYDLGEDAAGRWWVEVHRKGTLGSTGFELRVRPEGGPLAEDAPLEPAPPRSLGLPGGSCAVGLGLATGLVHLPGSDWTHLGVADTTAGASPSALGRCGLGGRLSVYGGAEVTPWLAVGGQTLAGEGQLGVELARSTFTAGAFASLPFASLDDLGGGSVAKSGALGPGLGVRFGWPVGALGGPELRFGWQSPVGGRATLAWVRAFRWSPS